MPQVRPQYKRLLIGTIIFAVLSPLIAVGPTLAVYTINFYQKYGTEGFNSLPLMFLGTGAAIGLAVDWVIGEYLYKYFKGVPRKPSHTSR